MSEETKTELKLPRNYKRPSLEEFVAAHYQAENYESFFAKHEAELSAKYTSGVLTDEQYDEDLRLRSELEKEMADADGDGLPDVLHVKSQVRAVANRTLRARHPTRHRFKQYLFGNPSLRLVRKRVLRLSAAQVRAGLDELLEKEAAGILTVHAPNGQRVNLRALKTGRVELAPLVVTPPLPNPPLDSAANDLPGGENMPQFQGGTFPNDPAAEVVLERIAAEKQDEAEKKGLDLPPADLTGDVDPADPALPTELEQPPMGVDGNTAPIVDQLPKDSEASVEAPAPEQTPVVEDPAVEESKEEASKGSGKHGKKGGKR